MYDFCSQVSLISRLPTERTRAYRTCFLRSWFTRSSSISLAKKREEVSQLSCSTVLYAVKQSRMALWFVWGGQHLLIFTAESNLTGKHPTQSSHWSLRVILNRVTTRSCWRKSPASKTGPRASNSFLTMCDYLDWGKGKNNMVVSCEPRLAALAARLAPGTR